VNLETDPHCVPLVVAKLPVAKEPDSVTGHLMLSTSAVIVSVPEAVIDLPGSNATDSVAPALPASSPSAAAASTTTSAAVFRMVMGPPSLAQRAAPAACV